MSVRIQFVLSLLIEISVILVDIVDKYCTVERCAIGQLINHCKNADYFE
jgi:hypothetical protein